jgi:uncharacterized protein involved in exopolysaccharide biosynthesis
MNEAPPAAPSSAQAPASSPGFELIFDPFRLAGALLERHRWIIVCAAAGFLLFLAAGLVRARDKHEAMARLIKREPPSSFRAGEIGEPYKPRPLTTATLVSSALSDNVLGRVSAQADPPISLGMLRLSVTATELRGTDFLQLTARRTESAQAAADLVNLWASEIVEFSRDIQSRESREVRAYLQQQIESTDADLAKVNRQVLDFSRRENLIDADKQTDVFLRQLADLDLRYETARIDLQTIEFKLKALEGELSRYSATDDRLVSARAELQDALGRYTEKNPVVQNLRAKVETLEAQAGAKSREPTLADYASTAIGGNLYLELIDLRARREGAQKQLEGIAALRDSSRARVEELPEKIAALARLRLVQRGLETARQLLAARLREATLFSERAPGYYQIFSTATAQSVGSTPRVVKIAAYGIAGLVLGAGFGLFLVAAREIIDQRLRSPAEARKLFKAPLLAVLEPGADPTPAIGSLWVTWATPASAQDRPSVLWAPLPDEVETRLWSGLLAEAARLQPDIRTLDAGPAASPALAGAARLDPAALTLAAARAATEKHGHAGLWVRLAGDTVEPALTLARSWRGVVLVVPADRAPISAWQRQARLLREAGITLHGLIVTDALPWWKRHRAA